MTEGAAGWLRPIVEKVKIRHHRRTCADDGDTDREILREIVCEERSDECAISRKILSRGISKGGTGRLGEAVPDGAPFCSVSGFPDTLRGRSQPAAPSVSYLIPGDVRQCLYSAGGSWVFGVFGSPSPALCSNRAFSSAWAASKAAWASATAWAAGPSSLVSGVAAASCWAC